MHGVVAFPDIPAVTDHAQRRAAERCAVPPNQDEWLQCVLDVLERRAFLIGVEGFGMQCREEWLAYLGEQPMVIVWAPHFGFAVTVLQPKPHHLLCILAQQMVRAG